MIVLKTLTLFLSVLGYMGGICSFGRVRITAAPVLAMTFIVLLLYVFGWFGRLFPGAVFALATGIVLGILALIRERGRLRGYLVPRNACYLLYLVPFLLLYRAIPMDFLFTGWDEFSFWAPSAKLLFETDALYQAASPITFKNYPPAQQLLQYYLTSLTLWSERGVLYAQVVFMLSAILCVTGSFNARRPLFGVLSFYVACAFIYFFYYDFGHIFADQLLSVYFAAALALALTLSNRYRHLLFLPAVLAVLVLTKQVGLLLALVVLGCYVLARGFEGLAVTGDWRTRARAQLPWLLTAVVGLVALFAAYRSWTSYVASINVAQNLAIPPLETFFQEPMLKRLGATLLEFLVRLHIPNFMVFAKNPVSGSLSLYGMTLGLLAASLVLIAIQRRGQRAKTAAVLAFLFLCALGYVAFLLLSYLLFFTEYEGLQLASFERYAASYYLAWLLVLYGLLCGRVDASAKRSLAVAVALASCVTFYFVPANFYDNLRGMHADPVLLQKRQKVDELVAVLKKHMSGYDMAYFISQQSTGYEKYAFNYAIQPFHSMWWCWSVGALYDEKDVWTCTDPLEKLLAGYAYVAIFHADARFWEDNGHLFDPGVRGRESGVFRIDSQDGKVVHLTEVQ
ncbi:hypothetical protein [Pseudomonas sp. RIT-PI-AD]|uniref:hypothetical protein n=1 Tax=Pseudomonas sp. RIT-PI-AD TaxID=3035294 RepID=UPI0021DA957C|nr:hypothetical protein [Pseudomonas sp. RIT-PI-AD]